MSEETRESGNRAEVAATAEGVVGAKIREGGWYTVGAIGLGIVIWGGIAGGLGGLIGEMARSFPTGFPEILDTVCGGIAGLPIVLKIMPRTPLWTTVRRTYYCWFAIDAFYSIGALFFPY